MDQLKIGKFIAQMRKEKGLTQCEVAEKLLISNKTVSKWECGNGLPEVSLMMPLCELLGISVNELLSAKRLTPSEYQKSAEANIMKLIKEKEETRFRMIIEVAVIVLTLLSGGTIMLISGIAGLEKKIKIALIVIALVVIFSGLFIAAALEMRQAVFECRKCGKRFIPTKFAYIMGMHTITRRHLRCPHCNKRSWCKRCMTLGETE
jgi:transcriptional regulator with XRE-family HTH domain/DNA-directed RNA polymerase subunit RPC12/RpoP